MLFHIICKSDATVWRMRVSEDANPVMTFPTKKKFNTELFIERMVALNKVNGRIKNVVRVVN